MTKTAYIFMEFQKDFIEGKLCLSGSNEYIKNAEKILEFARKRKEQVIHVHLGFSPNYAELINAEGILSVVREAKAFQRNSLGAEPIETMRPLAHETCIEKQTLSAFEKTKLLDLLHGVKSVVFLGLLSNVCLESSVREAYDKGFCVRVVKDATKGLSEQGHYHALEHTLPLFSKIVTTSELLA